MVAIDRYESDGTLTDLLHNAKSGLKASSRIVPRQHRRADAVLIGENFSQKKTSTDDGGTGARETARRLSARCRYGASVTHANHPPP